MQGVFFTCGGAESNESAFKTARFYWKAKGKPDKVKVIARSARVPRRDAPGHERHRACRPTGRCSSHACPTSSTFPTCYPYRQEGAKPGETAGQTAARLLEEAILREGPDTVAAFIAEPIHGGGGVIYPSDDYFPLVRKVCDKHQVLFIADEVITGFCRTGHWFAMTHWNVLPDIMSFAKGVSSGYLPLGGIMVSKDIKEAMDSVKPEDKWMHAYTYSGHPTCCAVGLKNVEIMERERLVERSATLGHAAAQGAPRGLRQPSAMSATSARARVCSPPSSWSRTRRPRSPTVADQKVGARIIQEMSKRGVDHARAAWSTSSSRPPLVITEAQLDRMVVGHAGSRQGRHRQVAAGSRAAGGDAELAGRVAIDHGRLGRHRRGDGPGAGRRRACAWRSVRGGANVSTASPPTSPPRAARRPSMALDVTDAVAVRAMVEDVASRWGGIDVLVNNAGRGLSATFEDTKPEELRELLELNVMAVFTATQAVLPWYAAPGAGGMSSTSRPSSASGACPIERLQRHQVRPRRVE